MLTEGKACSSNNAHLLYWNGSETSVGVVKTRKLIAKGRTGIGRTALMKLIPTDPKNGVFTLKRALGGFLGIDANGSLTLQVISDTASLARRYGGP